MAGLLRVVVGGAIGAAVGTANCILGIDRCERFRTRLFEVLQARAISHGYVRGRLGRTIR